MADYLLDTNHAAALVTLSHPYLFALLVDLPVKQDNRDLLSIRRPEGAVRRGETDLSQSSAAFSPSTPTVQMLLPSARV